MINLNFNIFGKKTSSILGVDIGTSAIKIVQLRKEEDKFRLETYGELSFLGYLEKEKESFQTTSLKTIEAATREMLKITIDRAEVSTKEVVMAIPVFSSFASVIEIPEMADKELEKAVEFEARKYVPISLSEVVLDWKIIDSGIIKNGTSDKPFKGKRILIIAVPKEVIDKYIQIAEELNLKIVALELESSSLARSLASNKFSVCVLDVGARATSFTIIDKGMVQMSHSLDVAGAELTRALSQAMGVGIKRAEDFKLTYGINHKQDADTRKELKDVLRASIDKIIHESERMILDYQDKTNRKVEKIILNGGSARLSGFSDYIEERLNVKSSIANPWGNVSYPTVIQPALEEIGPEFSVAVGAAMREK